ncbi:MAG: thioredoxin [Candidatus Thermoplasmatota archaeon]|nr:thioredoxin [Candidatus Thermoplasmatota archaeon]
MDELEIIKKKKLERLKKQYMNRGKTMENKWPDTPIHLIDADINENIQKFPTIVIDCWAPWCGPCRMIGPIVEELAKDMQGKIVFGKLNVDENPQTSMKYGIMSIPTMLVFKNGKLVDRVIGAMPKEMLLQKLRPYQ